VPNAPAATSGANFAGARPPQRRPGPLRVAFLGNMTHEPNVDAVEFFASQILPHLRARDPDAALDVIGPNATDALRARYASRVRFRGFVEDLGAALAEYDVMLAPLRFGGGTKLKVLDGMAHGIPVVTTAVGAEGLGLRHEEHALLADSADALAQCVLRVGHDGTLAARLTVNACAHVRAHFSWDTIRERLTAWLREHA
jgi:glycosyltransferase involved in cell wall biosynthesis